MLTFSTDVSFRRGVFAFSTGVYGMTVERVLAARKASAEALSAPPANHSRRRAR